MIARKKPELVALEASGGYERVLLERLLAKGVAVAMLNPRPCASSPGPAAALRKPTRLTPKRSHILQRL
jgi:transposase